VRGVRRAAPWLAAGLVLAVLGSTGMARAVPFLEHGAAIGHATAMPHNKTFDVDMTDAVASAYSPRFLSAPQGYNVSIFLTNQGHLTHTFTLWSHADARLNASSTPAELNASFHAYPPLVNRSVPAGKTAWANFTLGSDTGFDSFEFVSVVPYQFQAGMWGLFNVSSTAPGYLLSDNTTNSLSFQPSILYAPVSQFPANFAVLVTNLGDLAHTFTLAAQPNVTLTTTGYFAAHAPLVNQSIPSQAGKGAWANFTIPGRGVYEYVCTIPGHFTSGMYGFLYVGVTPPAAPPPPSTAIVDTWVLAGSVVLLGIGGLLVLVATFTGRFPRGP
jgi:uncharacterized cupredoxin-like copper-binding protein